MNSLPTTPGGSRRQSGRQRPRPQAASQSRGKGPCSDRNTAPPKNRGKVIGFFALFAAARLARCETAGRERIIALRPAHCRLAVSRFCCRQEQPVTSGKFLFTSESVSMGHPGQAGRPDFRRRAGRLLGPGPQEPRGLRNAGHHRLLRDGGRDHDARPRSITRKSPAT